MITSRLRATLTVGVVLLASLAWASPGIKTCNGLSQEYGCLNFSVPLNYDDTKGRQIYMYATIFRAGGGSPADLDTVDGIVWYLNFGCDGWLMDSKFNWMNDVSQTGNLAIITPNFRGDGMSYPLLSCSDDPRGEADPPSLDCAHQWANNQSYTKYFNLDSASQDVNALLQALKPSKPNYMVTTQHGSIWGQRMYAKYPKLFARSIFASYLNPMAFDFFASMTAREAVLRQVLRECEDDAQCANQLGNGANLQSTLDRVLQLAEMDLLPCNAHLAHSFGPQKNQTWRNVYGSIFADVMGPPSAFTRPSGAIAAFIAPLLYRIQRCDVQKDVPVITRFFNTVRQNIPVPTGGGLQTSCIPSPLLRANVLLNEAVRNDPTETVRFIQQATVLEPNSVYINDWLQFYTILGKWRSPHDNAGDESKWYPSSVGFMQAKIAGTIDAALPYAVARTSQLYDTSVNTTYVTLENRPGFLLDPPQGATACVKDCMKSYFVWNVSRAKLDACVNNTVALDLMGTSSSDQGARSSYFGNNVNPWDFTKPTGGSYFIPGIPFTTLAPPTTPSPGHTTTPAPTPHNGTYPPSPPPKKSHTTAIVLGILGTLVGLVLIVVIYKKCCGDRVGDSWSGGGGPAGGYSSYRHQQQQQQQQQPPAPYPSGAGQVQYGGGAAPSGGGGGGGGGGAASSWGEGGLYN